MTRARTLADFNAAGVLTSTSNLNATKLTSGTIPNGRYGAPTFNGANLTNVDTGETNTPAFAARSSNGFSQTVGSSSWTKVAFDIEIKDTDSAFDLSNERFTVPSGKAGFYSFQYSTQNDGKVSSNKYYQIGLYKNGSLLAGTVVRQNPTTTGSYDVYLNGSASLELAVGDYVEVYYYQNTGNVLTLQNDNMRFSGFRVT
jgi:hypothetical protein